MKKGSGFLLVNAENGAAAELTVREYLALLGTPSGARIFGAMRRKWRPRARPRRKSRRRRP